MKFDRLIFRKIFKFVATKRQILRLNAPNSISAGAPPGPAREHAALPKP